MRCPACVCVNAATKLTTFLASTCHPMPLFWTPYTSDVTNFIGDLKAKKPTLEAEQLAGRALLWDKTVSREDQAAWRDAAVPQQPYVYQTDKG